MKIAFLLPTLGMGGGYHVILQHARHALSQGHHVSLVLLAPPSPAGAAWCTTFGSFTVLPVADAAQHAFDLCIATAWETVYFVTHVQANHYAYFVQDIESWFFSPHDTHSRRLADATYLCPLPLLTVSRSIETYLTGSFERRAFHVPNGIKKSLFTPEGITFPDEHAPRLKILVEGPLTIPHKNMPRTLELVRQANVGEVWLVTSADIGWYPGVDKIFRHLTPEEMAEVYRSCDVMVKLSTVEGFGLPPLEMFHCGGTCIANKVMGRLDYMRHGENSLLVEIGDDEAVIQALRQLASTPSLLATLKAGALATARQWPSEEDAAAHFLATLMQITALPPVPLESITAALAPYSEIFFAPSPPPTAWQRCKQSLLAVRKKMTWIKRLVLPLYSRYILARNPTWAARSYTCSLSLEERTLSKS